MHAYASWCRNVCWADMSPGLMAPGLMRGFGAFVDWRRVLLVGALAAVPVLAVPFVASEFVVHVLAISAYYVILAASWNLLSGFTGQFSLAQHAFAAIGGYTSGLLIYHLKWPIWLTLPAGVVTAGLLGLPLGLLVLKMR